MESKQCNHIFRPWEAVAGSALMDNCLSLFLGARKTKGPLYNVIHHFSLLSARTDKVRTQIIECFCLSFFAFLKLVLYIAVISDFMFDGGHDATFSQQTRPTLVYSFYIKAQTDDVKQRPVC